MKNFELERFGACALNRVLGYEPAIAQRIIAETNSCSDIFLLSREERRLLLGPESKYIDLLDEKALDTARVSLTSLQERGYGFIPCFDENFPENLRQCEDCPTGLYVRSNSPVKDIFRQKSYISIVGTRDVSPYGKEWCSRIVSALSRAQQKSVIVSGLAIGVDIEAHMSSLAIGLGTIAVLPTGIDEVYPGRHRVAAEKISKAPLSAVISDYPPGTTPQAFTFLRRNRIIAGMSSATILIESKIHGGGMITAHLSFDYGRNVFVLPGRIDDIHSAGCNLLLREGIASPISDLESMVSALGLGEYDRRNPFDLEKELRGKYASSTSSEELDAILKLASCIKGTRALSIEEIAARTNTDYCDTLAYIGTLESDGFVTVDLMQRCTVNYKKNV